MKYHAIFLLFTIVLGLAAYSPSLHGPFVFDDQEGLVGNHSVESLKEAVSYDWKRRIPRITYAINYYFAKYETFTWKLTNFFIHVGVAYTLFNIALRMMSPIQSVVTGWLFFFHPMAVDTVAYIYERTVLLVTLFYLLTILFYILMRTKHWAYGILCIGSAILMTGCKEIFISLPLVIMLVEMRFRGRFVKPLVVICILWIAYCIHHQTINGYPVPPNLGYDRLEYSASQVIVFLSYFRMFFLPVGQSIVYDAHVVHNFYDLQFWNAALIVAIIIGISIYLWNKKPLISFGILFFFLALLPELLPVRDLMFSWRMYLPMIGLSLAFGRYLILSYKVVKGVAR